MRTTKLKRIKATPQLIVKNMDSLPRGGGWKFLLCMEGQNGELIAVKWCRKAPVGGSANFVLVTL